VTDRARFIAHAEPELRALIAALPLVPGAHILAAGAPDPRLSTWLLEHLTHGGRVVSVGGRMAIAEEPPPDPGADRSLVAELRALPFPPATFDLVWLLRTRDWLPTPLLVARSLAASLRPGGCLTATSTNLVPSMIFAWDEELERALRRAWREYRRDADRFRTGGSASPRRLVGLLREIPLDAVKVHTIPIDRIAPLAPATEAYLLETVFRGRWGHRLRPYLSRTHWDVLRRLTDPASPDYALTRPDFHLIETLTVVTGTVIA